LNTRTDMALLLQVSNTNGCTGSS